jgi:hypothetical protein
VGLGFLIAIKTAIEVEKITDRINSRASSLKRIRHRTSP